MKSQHAVRSIAFVTALVSLVGCHDKKPDAFIKEMHPISKETTQLAAPAVSVETKCGDVAVKIGRAATMKAALAPSPTPTSAVPGGAPMAAVWQSTPSPTPGFGGFPGMGDIDPECAHAINQYLILAKSIQGDPKPAPWPGQPPIPGPNLWSTDANYRRLAFMALGSALSRAGGPLAGSQFAAYAASNPGGFNAITSQFGVNGSEVMGLMNNGSLGLNTPPSNVPPQGIAGSLPATGTPPQGFYGQPTGYSLGKPNEQVMFAPQARSAAVARTAPQGVSADETLTSYRARYGADWFRQRAAARAASSSPSGKGN